MVLKREKSGTNDIKTEKCLPPKKRYKVEMEVEMKSVQKIKRDKKGRVSIIPGVIRHTSSPEHCIAYIYKHKEVYFI